VDKYTYPIHPLWHGGIPLYGGPLRIPPSLKTDIMSKKGG